ncbi:MAG: NAD(+)/NADH kinase [Kiritimatiellae bacterium]|nr:NAD(+)/NADH kinase [Kiritimatiellia bacterium]
MQRIGLIVNEAKPRAAEALRQVGHDAAGLGLTLFASPATVALAGGGPPWQPCDPADFERAVQAVVALGGDGTLLQAAHCLQDTNLPLMGLNIGSLGYLTSVGEGQFGTALRALREDRFEISERTMLSSRIRRVGGGTEAVDMRALNDVVVSRGASGRLAHIELALDEVPVTTYACDGLIVATATGSTAYSLAAGGPIVMPGTPALAICMICPHALGARPLIVPETTHVSIRVASAATPLLLAIDGRDDYALRAGDWVEVERSQTPARIVFLPGHDPYTVLSRKLGWGGRTS